LAPGAAARRSPRLSSAPSGFFGVPTRGWVAAGVAALVVAVIAFAIGIVTGRPDYPGEGSADAGFARDMSTHHGQAVEMGMIAYRNATLPEVRTLGKDIALTQQAQIGTMQGWLETWGLPRNTSAAPMAWVPGGEAMLKDNLMPGMATREEIAQLEAAAGQEADILFLQLMLRHHVGGGHMLDAVIADGSSPAVRAFAEQMKSTQQTEAVVIQNMLKELGASPIN
jgi:uncharacterized protein (DUF305 family)